MKEKQNAIKEKLSKNDYLLNANLSHLFSDNIVFAEFWISRYSKQNSKKLNFCYGLISDTRKNKFTEWKSSDFSSILTGINLTEQSSYKVAKVFLAESGKNIAAMVDSLLQGESFKAACEIAKLPIPPDKFRELKLVETKQDPEYVFRPPVTALPRNIIENLVSFRQGYSSPIIDTVATVASLYHLSKESLWCDFDGNTLPHSKDIIRGLTLYLSSQTGLQFNRFDIKRLGNIEWIGYNSIDKFEESYCSVKTSKKLLDAKTGIAAPKDTTSNFQDDIISCSCVVVNINKSGILNEVTDILIECSAYNDNDLIGDQAKTLPLSATIEVEFEFAEQISSCDVKIWIKKDRENNFNLWHHEHFDLIRTVNVSTNFDIYPDNSWFEDLIADSDDVNSKLVSNKKIKPMRLKLRDSDKNFWLDPWNPVGKAIRQLGLQVFPPTSDAFFFLKSGEDDQPRIEALSDWLKKTINKRQPNTCVFFDPYFDTLGVDLLMSIKDIKTNFIVVTNSQVKSNDDTLNLGDHLSGIRKILFKKGFVKISKIVSLLEWALEKFKILEHRDEESTQRANRIKAYCNQNQNKLRNFPIKIYDLVSKNASSRQYFHDRHLLFFDSNGKLKSGYNFSNSIQGAMKRYPLLITPIPSDIIESVEKHTYEFLFEKMNFPERKKDLLFTSIQKIERNSLFKKGIDSLSEPAKFFSILLSDNTVESLSIVQLKSNLFSKGIVDQEGNFVTEQIINYHQNVFDYLNSNPHDFWLVWCDFSEILARVHTHEIFYDGIDASPFIVTKIKDVLSLSQIGTIADFVTYPEDLTLLENHIGMNSGNNFSQSLTKIRNVEHFYHHQYMRIQKYGLGMAIEIASKTGQLVAVIEALFFKQNKTEEDRIILLKCIEEIYENVESLTTKKSLSLLAHSNLPYLKAIAAHKIYDNRNAKNDVFDLAWVKSLFSGEEFALILSEWIYDLRVRANRKGRTVIENDDIFYKKFTSEIVSIWNFSKEHLRDVLERSCGPIFGSWSISSYNDICMALVEANKISFPNLAEIWLIKLIDKIQDTANGKAHFYEPADTELTAVSAHIYANLKDVEADDLFKAIKKLIENSLLQVERERIRSINFNLWYRNMDAIYWLHGFLLHLLSHQDQNAISHRDELVSLLKRVSPITLNPNNGESMNSLHSWLVRVEKYFSEITKEKN